MSKRPLQPPRQQSAVHPLLPQAVALHQAGHTAEAAKIYQQILAQVPRHFDATHLLGVIALQGGRLDQAEHLITSALEINPKDANDRGLKHDEYVWVETPTKARLKVKTQVTERVAAGTTVLAVSHDDRLNQRADRLIEFVDGRVLGGA